MKKINLKALTRLQTASLMYGTSAGSLCLGVLIGSGIVGALIVAGFLGIIYSMVYIVLSKALG